ncbi:MAG: hypothetical protein IH588_09480 [Anaerolineales bacterium]|nr:hypothetical protein [Anaerolineales bacterium]
MKQEEFAPFGDDTGVVARVESLPLAAHLHHHCVRCSAGEAARGLRAGADTRRLRLGVHAAGAVVSLSNHRGAV